MSDTPPTMDPPVHRSPLPPRDASITLRLTASGLAAIDAAAAREQRTRSDMVRILLARGLAAR